MSIGNPGTLVAGGVSNAATAVATGNTPFGTPEFLYDAGVSSFNLAAGSYWLGIAVNGGDGNIFCSTANGTNGVGGPLNDGNSFINSPSFAINYDDAAPYIGDTIADFSMGLRGTNAVPEPASLVVLGLGAVALLRRRRK